MLRTRAIDNYPIPRFFPETPEMLLLHRVVVALYSTANQGIQLFVHRQCCFYVKKSPFSFLSPDLVCFRIDFFSPVQSSMNLKTTVRPASQIDTPTYRTTAILVKIEVALEYSFLHGIHSHASLWDVIYWLRQGCNRLAALLDGLISLGVQLATVLPEPW